MDEMQTKVLYQDKYEWHTLEPKARPITWRNWWSIVRGTYEPDLYLVLVEHLTSEGMNRELKKHYLEPLTEALNDKRSLLENLNSPEE